MPSQDPLRPDSSDAGRGPGREQPAASELEPEVYAELRAVAAGYLRGRAAGATLQPTVLVHEAWVRLARPSAPGTGPRWRSATHFAALAAKVMRDVLVDQLRARRAQKRGGGCRAVTLQTALAGEAGPTVDVLALHEALARLAAIDSEQARIVELRFFGGLTGDEIAEVQGISRRTVVRELQMAQAWLLREMQRGDGHDER
ncbi:MAG: ECF-type sigma factor [bacterium]|nr:ECF-type sigma factor [bacterium]